MIARIWRGITLKDKADDYLAYLHETGLRDYAKTPGNRGVTILRRNQGEHCEIMLISLWESMDAVRRLRRRKSGPLRVLPRGRTLPAADGTARAPL
jgi:heme-degrading monooxygenase HmoA